LLGKVEFAQPVCTAVQVALVNFLAKCGVKPIAVVGHSSGEIAAAYAAMAITKNEAILCAYYRGLATNCQTRKGIMTAVGLGRDAVSPFLVDGAVVACENSDSSVTLSGDEQAVEQTLKAIKSKDLATFARRLHVDMAYHSRKITKPKPKWHGY
jgi:acyl transferase domain-containing protein